MAVLQHAVLDGTTDKWCHIGKLVLHRRRFSFHRAPQDTSIGAANASIRSAHEAAFPKRSDGKARAILPLTWAIVGARIAGHRRTVCVSRPDV